MLFFLLSLIFNPFGFILSYLPASYLAAWPVIIQTLGREALLSQALLLVIFILISDISRQLMLRLIGYDLISLPIGVALVGVLLSNKGSYFLTFITQIFESALVVVEPMFLIVEALLLMQLVQNFNKWISRHANERDNEAHDISTWDPPLSRGAVITRGFIVLITIACYLFTYSIVQESRSLLGTEDTIPVNFNHALIALVTLQLIALPATVYKEDGIISETAMMALAASLPMFMASWSYQHMLKTSDNSSLSWFWNYFLSFSTPSAGTNLAPEPSGNLNFDPNGQFEPNGAATTRISFEMLQESANQLGILDFVSKQMLRRLATLINSLFGLSMNKLAKYYFEPDFWLILFGRLACLSIWALGAAGGGPTRHRRGGPTNDDEEQPNSGWRASVSKFPISRQALVKILLVLAYTQMLVQQMDNRENLHSVSNLHETKHDGAGSSWWSSMGSAGCCQSGEESEAPVEEQTDLGAWFECMWTSARACSASKSAAAAAKTQQMRASRASRILESLLTAASAAIGTFFGALEAVQRKLVGLFAFLSTLRWIWLARWRSPIVQRLAQSILMQVHFVWQLVFVYE